MIYHEFRKISGILQRLAEDTIIGDPANPEMSVAQYHGVLTSDLIASKNFKFIACQQMRDNFVQEATAVGIKVYPRFIYFRQPKYDLSVLNGFNKRYAEAVVNNDFDLAENLAKAAMPDFHTASTEEIKYTHAMAEVIINGKPYAVCPTCGLIYPASAMDMVRGFSVFTALKFLGQDEYLAGSIQQNQYTLTYATSLFWKSIYFITENPMGGL